MYLEFHQRSQINKAYNNSNIIIFAALDYIFRDPFYEHPLWNIKFSSLHSFVQFIHIQPFTS